MMDYGMGWDGMGWEGMGRLLCHFYSSVLKESPHRDVACAPTCCKATLDLQELERGEREILHCVTFCDTWIFIT